MNHALDLPSDYNYLLALLALVVASCASFCALELVALVAGLPAAARRPWLLLGAGVFGLGVWAMHFIGMLAFSLPTPVGYHLPTVALSLLPAVAAAALALGLATGGPLTPGRLVGGAVLMGVGIGAMHYGGMFAMRMAAVTYYEPIPLLGSVGLAVGASLLALYMAFSANGEGESVGLRGAAALVMGLAITVLHFSAMFFASSFAPAGAAVAAGTLTTPWTRAEPAGPLVVQIPPAVAVLLTLVVLAAVSRVLARIRVAHAAHAAAFAPTAAGAD